MATNPSAFGNAPTGPAGGSLTGTYPNPVISQTQAQPWLPSDAGFLGWTFDPGVATSTSVITAGTIFLYRVNVRSSISVTNVWLILTAGGSVLTSGENFAGLYNSSGTQVGITADQTTNWGAAFNSAMPLVGGPFALTAGFYWVAALANGTTGPTALGGANSFRASDLGLSAAQSRYASNGTGTALPASITPASNVAVSNAVWAGLS